MTEGQIKQANNNLDTHYAVAPTFSKDAGGFMQVDNVKMDNYRDMSNSQNTSESKVNSVDKGNRENYTNTYDTGNRFTEKDTHDSKDTFLTGKLVDTANNTTTGEFAFHGAGGNINSLLKGMQTPDASPGFTQSPHREALHNTYNAAYADQTGSEANYLANTLSSDLDSIVSGSKNNSDIMSVASNESAKAGWDLSKVGYGAGKLITGFLGTEIKAGVNGGAKQEQQWSNGTTSQVNNAMVRGMLESSNGDMDKFNQDYMSYKNALLDMGQDAKDQSDLDGKK